MHSRSWRPAALCGFLLVAPAVPAGAADPDPKKIELFESKIRPVLVKHCYSCHSAEGANKKVKGGLRVDTRDGLRDGGDSGPAVVAGDPTKSLIVRALKGDGVDRMPPSGPLPAAVVADFELWIRDGAADPRTAGGPASAGIDFEAARRHWAFQPVKPPAVPPVRDTSWPKGDIDRFVLAKLEEKGLRQAPPADRRMLARRVFFDLTGLPPTPEEMNTFLTDSSPDAYPKLVDRLLASPHYGVKWGRHWLDVVRYADTAGETADFPVPAAWRYRNYVIDAFNADKPFDRFVREQVAGDILARTAPREKYPELVTATGYLAISRRFGFDVRADHYLTIEDTIDTLGKSILGLTLGCARCHDHKYDPVPATDYYALYGIFESTKYATPGCEKEKRQQDLVPLVPAQEYARVVGAGREKVARIDAELPKIRDELKAHSKRLAELARKETRVLAAGEFDDGGAADLGDREVEVRAGQVIQLVVLPRANHGADSTLVEFAVKEQGGKGRAWAVTDDVIDDLLAANPHADRQGNAGVWGLLDLRGG
ncbi:MAG: hypothetical protein JWO38_3528, partial [Gemmataceae bacterium]|nr:hypothetical protein [Gemmataceae bacterium]